MGKQELGVGRRARTPSSDDAAGRDAGQRNGPGSLPARSIAVGLASRGYVVGGGGGEDGGVDGGGAPCDPGGVALGPPGAVDLGITWYSFHAP